MRYKNHVLSKGDKVKLKATGDDIDEVVYRKNNEEKIDKIKKDEIKKGLEHCSAIDFETGCSDCPYRYRCVALFKDALNLITEQEKEIEQLKIECNQQAETLAEEQEACVECELEHSWELFVRDKEIDRLRAESKRKEYEE